MSKGFDKYKVSSEYDVIDFTKIAFAEREKEIISNTQKIDTKNSLYISSSAKENIFSHIGWGKDISSNSVEQGGLLIGHSYKNRSDNSIIGHVEVAIPATTAKGSMTYLEFNHATWKMMMDKLDAINEATIERDLQIIGWYHTHPGRLSVFMSGTDMNTQRKMFSKEWQFAIVLNPQKQFWRAFNGRNAEECNGYMLSK
ncbi:JAB1/Mov34/MPN/PAD-1 ubiquitin protease [Kordia periserrulae]|uniref:JAB1/Mov34/MPN/PAD-1 ubiquitin protease n=1 Tax=Kordia periserrulae TaxID=701523 RepID=A0A2T6BYI1_9FLAO|nr:Mov34/MPN/PAD-1 family protein [Kordia periserrulae]PTX61108.1 JAB1/Mov34/MPN/PAD-1 ubiquitin protease [Kordia periserrulae]